jgi:hypothetical protein
MYIELIAARKFSCFTWKHDAREVKAVDQLQFPLQIFPAHQVQQYNNILHMF